MIYPWRTQCILSLMETQPHEWRVITTALVAGMTLYALLNWGPIARRFNILEPRDPARGLRVFFIIFIAVWVVVGIAVSIGLLLKVLGGG